MNILFIYDSPLLPENGGTERATKLVMDELSYRGHRCIGILHFNQERPDDYFLNGEPIESLSVFLNDNRIDLVINQIAFHPRFLSQFLEHGGQEWKDKGGKIVSFMHLDPTPAPRRKLKSYFSDWKQKSLVGKFKRLILILLLPYLNYRMNKAYRIGLRYLYENSDYYVLMSESFLDSFKKMANLIDSNKVRFIPNMLTFPEIASVDIIQKKEYKVLVVARLDDEQKNISFIIDAWKSLKNHYGYTLHILGNGQDKQILQDKVKGLTNIKFEGQLSPLCWYQRAKIFLMASPREGWGLTLTESLQNGVVPVILNTSTVFCDIINNGENGFLANNKNEYMEFLEKLMTDSELLGKMALKGLESAERFTPEAIGDLWTGMLNEIEID